MAYEKIEGPKGMLYHYTKKKNVEAILKDERIRRFTDRECWFCTSLENTLRLMEFTVMQEGKRYYDARGLPQRYPVFVPEDYVILELLPRFQNGEWVIWNQEFPENTPEEVLKLGEEFSRLKVGYRGDLKFYNGPKVYDVAELLSKQEQVSQMIM